ncbi:MAG: hypothetical protein ABIC40_03160, partial [bacterium]
MRPVELDSDEQIRTIHLSNIEAIKEARNILLPLRPYILESSNAHDIDPNAIATLILVNRMVKAKRPTYDFKNGLAHVLWEQGASGQKNLKDLSPLTESSVLGKLLVQILPAHIQLQDDAVDIFTGLVLGLSPTIGNMQIRADMVPSFENEKSVKVDNLWSGLNIDLSALTNRQINRMLLINPRLDIEAGTAALKQSIDQIPKISKMDWYDIFSEANTHRYLDPDSKEDVAHSIIYLYGPYGLVQDLRVVYVPTANYPLFYIIAVESGVFNDKPAIITGATTSEQSDYLRKLATDKDPYISEAAMRTLEAMENS